MQLMREQELMRTNIIELEAFTFKLACGFASTVVLLLLVGFLLLVMGLVGVGFPQDVPGM